MRRSDRRRLCTAGRGACVKLAVPLCLLFLPGIAGPVRAHTLSLTRGDGTITPTSLHLSLCVMAEDFLHFDAIRPLPDGTIAPPRFQDAIKAYKAVLLDALVIRDERGERLTGSVLSAEPKEPLPDPFDLDAVRRVTIAYEITYKFESRPRLLTFQQAHDEAAAALPSHMILTLACEGTGCDRTLKLTNGGNVEIVEIDWSAGADDNDAPTPADSCDPRAFVTRDRNKSVSAIVHRNSDCVRIEVYMSTRLLESWHTIPRASEDSLSVEEQQAARAHLSPLFTDRLHILADGVEVPATLERFEFLDFQDDPFTPGGDPQPRSYWSSRVAVGLRFDLKPAQPETDSVGRPDPGKEGRKAAAPPVEVRWELLNNLVLTARGLVVANGTCREVDFSAYNPALQLPLIPRGDAAPDHRATSAP